jgi:hypothetical protein
MDSRCARGRPQCGRSDAAGLASGRDKLRAERGHRHDVGGVRAACGQYVGVRVGVLGVRAGRTAERLRRTSGRPALIAATAAFSAGNTSRAAACWLARNIDAADDETQVEIEALSGRVESTRRPRLAFQRLVRRPDCIRRAGRSSPSAVGDSLHGRKLGRHGRKALAVPERRCRSVPGPGPYRSYSRAPVHDPYVARRSGRR